MVNDKQWDKAYWDNRNRAIIEEFRANQGQVEHHFPVLLLHTTGAKSGLPRINPLVYMVDDERYVIIAAKTGVPTNPDWYHNIVANSEVFLEVDSEQFHASATITTEPERTRLYAKMVAMAPIFDNYQRATTRIIPVITLKRI